MLENEMPESEKLTGAKKRKTRGYKPPGSEWERLRNCDSEDYLTY